MVDAKDSALDGENASIDAKGAKASMSAKSPVEQEVKNDHVPGDRTPALPASPYAQFKFSAPCLQ